MTVGIALLRGINVGGRNRLPMADLRSLFTGAGCSDVKTYIQSGNVVFRIDAAMAPGLGADVGAAVEANFGFRPAIQVLAADDLQQAIVDNPFPEAESTPSALHVSFLDAKPDASRVASARDLLSATESMTVIRRRLYLHAPDGIGRSKFAAGAERALGVSMTGRNWRTITKLAELAASMT